MALLKAAGKMGAAALKKMFTGMFDGDKKRTASKSKPKKEAKESGGEFAVFGAGVIETNEILTETVNLQKEQNVILDEILNAIKNIKSGDNSDGPDIENVKNKKKPVEKEQAKKTPAEENRKAALKEKAAKITEEKVKNPQLTSKEAKAKIEAAKPVELPKPLPVEAAKPVETPKPVEAAKPVEAPKPVNKPSVASKAIEKPVEAPHAIAEPHSNAKSSGKFGAVVGGGMAAAGGGGVGQIAVGAAEGAAMGAGVAVSESVLQKAIVKIVGPKLPKIAAAAVPGVGLVTGIGFGIWRAMSGDFKGAAAEVTSGALSAAGGAAAVGTLGIGAPAAIAASAGAITIQAGLLARDVYQAVYGKFPDDDPESAKNLENIASAVKDYIFGNVPKIEKDAVKENDKEVKPPDATSEVKPDIDSDGGGDTATNIKQKQDGDELATNEKSAQIISFEARDIKFTAKDMIIKTSEIKINGVTQGAAGTTPAGGPAGATPPVLGTQPTPPGTTADKTPGGAPGGQTPSGPDGLTSITAKSGNSTKVGATYAPNFQSFINDLEATGYKIASLGGYANRSNANNPSVKSFHAMGAAIDINPGSNPNRSTKTDLPQETGALAAKHGLGWGMNWKSVKDPMHFSAAKSEQGSFDVQRGSMASYASGTDYVPETGPAIVGEKGSELVMSQDGSSRLTVDGPHAENLQKGDSVLPADKTKGYIEGENSFLNYNMATGEKFKSGSLVNLRQRAHGQRISESVAEDNAGFGRMQFGADGTDYGAHNRNFYYDKDVMGEKVTATGYYNQITDKHHSPESGIKQNVRNRPEAIQGKLDRWNMNDNAKRYAEGTANAEKEIRKRGPNFPHVERSGSYMSRPRYFDSAEQMYVAMGDRPAGPIGSYTEKDDRESYEVIQAFQRGEKPDKPAGMTQKEYMNRIKDYGALAMLKGNLSPEELQKATKQAEQPLWTTKAQNKKEDWAKSVAGVRGPNGEKISVKPLVAPSAPANTDAGNFAAMDHVQEAKPSSRDDWAKGATGGGIDWELESLDKGRQPAEQLTPPTPPPSRASTASAAPPQQTMQPAQYDAMGGVTVPAGMGPASGDLLKAYLTSGQ